MTHYYKIVVYVLLLATGNHSFAQPKLVATLGYWGPKNGGSIVRTDLPGVTPGTIYSFDNSAPHAPAGGVCTGDANWLYGVTRNGGSNNRGTFYRIQDDGTLLTKLYDLTSNSGASFPVPYYHTDGNVYFGNGDTINKYNTANGTILSMPANALLQSRNFHIDTDDWIYFVEQAFPARLVRMQTNGSVWVQLHSFNTATEGDNGLAGVTEIPGDTLFGLQSEGGTNNGGTIYSLLKNGSGFVVHHQFTAATGTFPLSKLVYFDGKLYGTTSYGGDYNKGVLFCINSDGSNYRVLHHFGLGDGTWTENPYGNIAISSNGRIFGAFSDMLYSNFQYYRLYKVDTSGQNFEPFFTGNSFNSQRINGEFGQDILLLEDEEVFFTTSQYGKNDGGVLNHCDTSGNGNDLYHFGNSPNGFRPFGGVIKASDGKLYGATTIGGPEGSGVIFSMNADGTGFTRLKQLTDAEGYEPSGKLLEASDGKLYGACRNGGTTGSGCIYRINKNGTGFQVIYSYDTYSGGYSPVGGLVEDAGGTLYGANFWPWGSLFKINKDGSNYTELKIFASGTDLSFPYNGLRLSGNYLYGACGYGGTNSKGGLFRMKTDGSAYQVLHEFDGTDGELPVGTLLLASNGKLYGSTAFGGTGGDGFLFSIDTSGTNFTTLKDLSSSDGNFPWTGMIQASDGLIYGGTQTGGTNLGGTIFKMNLNGSAFTVVKNFNMDTEGQGVYSLIDLNGNFVLPVELISFNAEKRGQTTLLTWKTAQEQNSDRFDIERSSNGTTFNAIGSVAAAGTTNTISNYSFTDNDPVNGINYYRLKQIDKDGSFTYSKRLPVNCCGC